ncbi:WD40 repeat domain-containing protein, partial [Streptomyces olivaceus]|uniref:WD40 repeat domain-containing protein n=1 Tax=Streptomyces olivaceus TaxID=47716 RepID=UPI003687AA2A
RTHKQIGAPMKDPTASVSSVAFSSDGTTLATGSYGGGRGSVRLWNPHTRQQIGAPITGLGDVHAVAFSSDGTTLATAFGTRLADDREGGSLRLWDTHTHRQIGAPLIDQNWLRWVAFSSNGTLASGSNDGTVRLWHVTYVNDPVRYLCDEVGRLGIPWADYVPPGPSRREICP